MSTKDPKSGICSTGFYHFLAGAVRVCLRICHPVIRIRGLENLPEGAAVLCANHSAFSDPIWIIAWSRLVKLPRTMAKKELFGNAFTNWFFTFIGGFPVDRGNTDIVAIKTALHTLKEGNKLLIFPEGTRVRKGKVSEPHPGAVLIAHRIKAPIVPIYLSTKKGLFRPVDLIVGTPYAPEFSDPKPDSAALQQASQEMLDKIYALGDRRHDK